MADTSLKDDFVALIDDMTSTLSTVRDVVKVLRETSTNDAVEMKDGISLLSVKHQVLLSYIHSLLLLSAKQTLGATLTERDPPSDSFSSHNRGLRGSASGDLVDYMLQGRLVLEKVKLLEGRMRYQINKLVKTAQEPVAAKTDVDIDPLAFRPNLENFGDVSDEEANEGSGSLDVDLEKPSDGIYRPPRLAPVPYTVTTAKSSKRDRNRKPVPSALASLVDADPSMPHVESTSGLGNTPSLASGRAKYLKRLEDYEEENFTRLFMKKKDAKQRLRDEEDLALGGTLSNVGRGGKNRRKGGFEDEFGDILRSSERLPKGDSIQGGDGYDELRRRGKKRSLLERSHGRAEELGAMDDGPPDAERDGQRKRTKFEARARRMKLGKGSKLRPK